MANKIVSAVKKCFSIVYTSAVASCLVALRVCVAFVKNLLIRAFRLIESKSSDIFRIFTYGALLAVGVELITGWYGSYVMVPGGLALVVSVVIMYITLTKVPAIFSFISNNIPINLNKEQLMDVLEHIIDWYTNKHLPVQYKGQDMNDALVAMETANYVSMDTAQAIQSFLRGNFADLARHSRDPID